MDEPHVDAAEFARLAEELFPGATPEETAGQVVTLTQAELDADHVSVTMIGKDGLLDTPAATDPLAVAVDKLQDELGEGPCLDLSWMGETLLSSNLAEDRRWPRWAPAAVGMGVHSVLGVEIRAGEGRIGTLCLYGEQLREFSADDIAFAHIFTRHAALALRAAEHRADLDTALDGRKLIGQAQGILMERYGVDDARAFDILRSYSQDYNIKLRHVADELVANRRLPGER